MRTVAPARPSSGDSLPDAALAPTTAIPWNPSRPVPRSLPWEAALRFPGRVVSLPFSALGVGTKKLLLVVESHRLVPRTTHTLAKAPMFGVAFAPASLGDRTGFGARVSLSPPPIRSFMRLDWSGSTRGYDRTRLELFRGPATLAYGYEWRPVDRFYGLGLQSREPDVSAIASQGEHVTALLQWPSAVADLARVHPRVSAWAGPRSVVIRQAVHDAGAPSFDARFPALAGQRDLRAEHLNWGGELAWDARGGVPHWSHGWRLLARGERFDRPVRALAFRDARGGGASFNRYQALAEGGASFGRDPRTLRLTLAATHQEITSGAERFLLTDLATLGGAAGLTGYEPGRFHDLDRLVGRLSYIFPLAGNYEFDLHAEAGGVYPDVRHDARLATLKPSYGAAFRPRNRAHPLGSVGVDWSPERLRFRYSIGGVE